MVSMTHRPYDEDFKKSIVALYQNGKTQSQLSKEYGVSLSAIWKVDSPLFRGQNRRWRYYDCQTDQRPAKT